MIRTRTAVLDVWRQLVEILVNTGTVYNYRAWDGWTWSQSGWSDVFERVVCRRFQLSWPTDFVGSVEEPHAIILHQEHPIQHLRLFTTLEIDVL